MKWGWCSRTFGRIGFLLALVPGAAPASAVDGAKLAQNECELGITLALRGRPTAAESVFTSLLTHMPRDPRAFTNLGNLALMRGEPDLALAFYEHARKADSTDAGILLNQATALMLLGEEDLASDQAAEGVRRAGGTKAAAGLLGLRYRERNSETPKAEPRAYVSKEELLNLLRAAARKVPADTVRAGEPPDSARGVHDKKHPPVWRSAGPRAGAPADVATHLYWKR